MTPTKKFWFPLGPDYAGEQGEAADSQLSMRAYSRGKWTPDTDIYEVQDGLRILMDIAGVNRTEIRIVVDGDVLSISGERKEPAAPGKQSVYRLEIDFGRFEKRFRIPHFIDGGHIEARYDNGFLHVSLPRKKSRKIDITEIEEDGNGNE